MKNIKLVVVSNKTLSHVIAEFFSRRCEGWACGANILHLIVLCYKINVVETTEELLLIIWYKYGFKIYAKYFMITQYILTAVLGTVQFSILTEALEDTILNLRYKTITFADIYPHQRCSQLPKQHVNMEGI